MCNSDAWFYVKLTWSWRKISSKGHHFCSLRHTPDFDAIPRGKALKFGINFFLREKTDAKNQCHLASAQQNSRRFDEIFRENTVFFHFFQRNYSILRYFDEIFSNKMKFVSNWWNKNFQCHCQLLMPFDVIFYFANIFIKHTIR